MLEVWLLLDELSCLWDRLGGLGELNAHKLVVGRREPEVVLESVEDEVLVLDTTGDTILISHRVLSPLGLAKDDVQGKPRRDLSASAPNYMALRDGLHDDIQGKQEITLHVGGEECIYAGRRQSLLSSKGAITGQVFLLSDMTEKRRCNGPRSEITDRISHELKTSM